MKDLIADLRADIFFYLHHLGMYDYIAISLVLSTFLVVLILATMIVIRHQFFGALLFIANVAFLCFGAFFAYKFVDDNTRARELKITQLKQLEYTDVVVVDLNLTNKSKKSFHFCRVNVKFHKNSKNAYKDFINRLKPFKNRLSEINATIAPRQTHQITMIIKDFRPSDYNVTTSSECF